MLYFKEFYTESDHYRRIKLADVQDGIKQSKFELEIIKEQNESKMNNKLTNFIQELVEKRRQDQEERMMFAQMREE